MDKVIQLPFSISSDGSVAHTSSDVKIWQDRVLSAVMTRFNERVLKPSYGSAVAEALFATTENAQSLIISAVEEAFSRHLPALKLTDCKVFEDAESGDGSLSVSISFTYPRLASQSETSITVKTQYISRSGDVLLEVGNGR